MQRVIPWIVLCLVIVSSYSCWAVGLPPNTRISIVANADYIDVFNEPQSSAPATVTLIVLQVVGVDIEWFPRSAEVVAGQRFYVPVKITNIGNAADTFDLAVTSSRGWNTQLLYDENADGVLQEDEDLEITDTMLLADGYCACFAVVQVPAGATDGDVVTVRATSRTAPGQGSKTVNIAIAPPGTTSTRIALSAIPDNPMVGQQINISGVLTPVVREPVNIAVTAPAGNETVSNPVPAVDGSFGAVFTPVLPGRYRIQASYPGNERYTASAASLEVDVVNKSATSVSLQATPANTSVGSEVAITGVLTPAMAAVIELSYRSPAGQTTQLQANTDEFGRFAAATTVGSVGEWQLTARYAGNAVYAASAATVLVAVEELPGAHVIRFTTPPAASPLTVRWPESTQLSAEAEDSEGHSVGYSWSDGGAGGTFTPSSGVVSPVYLAPQNTTGTNQTITISCTAKCMEDDAVAVVGSLALTVQPANHNLPAVKSVAPQSGSSMVELDADVVIRFSKAMSRNAVQQAISFTPAVIPTAFIWDGDNVTVTVSHDAFTPGTDYTCTVSTSARDSAGAAMQSAYSWTFRTVPGVRFDPSDTGAAPSSTFATPRVLVSDPLQSGNVSLKIRVPAGIVVNDTLDAGGSLVCVRKGSDAGELHSEWNQSTREISISATVPEPSASMEIVKAIRLGTTASTGAYQLHADGVPALTVRVRQPIPGDFNGDGVIDIADAVRFTMAWVRWQAEPRPVYDEDIDAPFDLAPHTTGNWPNWTIIGDHVIDGMDADAFTECWSSGRSSASIAALSRYTPLTDCRISVVTPTQDAIVVSAERAANGMFEAVVQIPEDVHFDPVLSSSGMLANVVKGEGAGSVFFSEYDAQTRTVRITGTVRGKAPYSVAKIGVSR